MAGYLGATNKTRGGASCDEVAAELGITKQGAAQLEHRILARLRKKLEAAGLTLDDLLPEEPRGWMYPDYYIGD